ncbi:MAG TPA: lanthionine synthetase LanC family protein, partial [Polyangia bacterium]
NDDGLAGQALALARTIEVSDAARDERLDVAGGAAGAILALAPLLSASGDAHVRALIVACGEHLLDRRRPSAHGSRAWVTVGGRMLTGFSHGAAGIALALASAAVATGRADFAAAAAEGVRYENALFDFGAGNWPDLRPGVDAPFAVAWCAGAGGIALARTAMAAMLDERDLGDDAERAILALRQSAAPPLDHLCCGVLGRAEVLRELGQRLDRPVLIAEADTIVAAQERRARSRGGYLVQPGPLGTMPNPGLFVGWSGVGYALLRAAAPRLVPSVLLPT